MGVNIEPCDSVDSVLDIAFLRALFSYHPSTDILCSTSGSIHLFDDGVNGSGENPVS
jgi:hypothetical protein